MLPMARIILVPAWALKRSDQVETTEGICAVVRIRRAREFGPGQPVDIEMEVLDGGQGRLMPHG